MSENSIITLIEEMESISRQINDLKKEIKRIENLRQKKAILEEKLSNVAKACKSELDKVAA